MLKFQYVIHDTPDGFLKELPLKYAGIKQFEISLIPIPFQEAFVDYIMKSEKF